MSPGNTSTIQSNTVYVGDDIFITVFANGELKTIGDDHPNFKRVVGLCANELQNPGTVDAAELSALLDPVESIKRGFERLTERVTVEDGQIKFDGDAVDGTLQQQILDFLEAGEDFGPLVNFYEKLMTNPLGNVQEGLFTWIKGQKSGDAGYNGTADAGAFSITPEGDIIGYKSMTSATPAWREGDETVYIPSQPSQQEDRVNDTVVPLGKYIEQRPGDTVEMPRSKVLNAPSVACGDGLHIGTWAYASGFTGDTVMLVKFSPRDIVSLPDSNSTWKLRVCRYTVLGPCDGPLDAPLYITEDVEADVDDQIVSVSQGEADLYV